MEGLEMFEDDSLWISIFEGASSKEIKVASAISFASFACFRLSDLSREQMQVDFEKDGWKKSLEMGIRMWKYFVVSLEFPATLEIQVEFLAAVIFWNVFENPNFLWLYLTSKW